MKTKAPRSLPPVPVFAFVLHPLAASFESRLQLCPASIQLMESCSAADPRLQLSVKFCSSQDHWYIMVASTVIEKKRRPKRRGQIWSSSHFWRHCWIYLNRLAEAHSALNYMPDHEFLSYFPMSFWVCPNWHAFDNDLPSYMSNHIVRFIGGISEDKTPSFFMYLLRVTE